MEKIDWNNPPNQLRFAINLKRNEVTYISDDLNSKGYNTKEGIKKVFASGSRLVNIAVNGGKNLSKWRLIPDRDHSDYFERGRVTEIIRHLTYERIK